MCSLALSAHQPLQVAHCYLIARCYLITDASSALQPLQLAPAHLNTAEARLPAPGSRLPAPGK